MFRFLRLNNVSILEQLRIEEALLRASSENWCLLNSGSAPAVVMGISGKAEKLLDLERVSQEKLPIIRRFSGGGTVYVDQETIFATLICNAPTFNLPLQPKAILQWSANFYQPLLQELTLRENDYVFGDRKVGGNAQYFQRERWLLHTSFLWEFNSEKMNCLLLPEKRPAYRESRSHADFLCTLRPLFHHKELFLEKVALHFKKALCADAVSLDEIQEILQRPHRKATQNAFDHSL